MSSLITLTICMAIGFFFEPGWRLLPGARQLAAEHESHHSEHHHAPAPEEHHAAPEHEKHEKHGGEAAHGEHGKQEHGAEHGAEHGEHGKPEHGEHAEHGEHGGAEHGAAAAEGQAPPQQQLPAWLVQGQTAVGNFNEQLGKVAANAKSATGPLISSGLVWLKSPVGIEVAVPYALLSTALLWWRYHEWVKAEPVPVVRPTSPMAPKLQLGDAQDVEEPFEAWTTAFLVFFFGVGLGLGLARALYQWSQGPACKESADPKNSVKVVPVAESKPALEPKSAGESKRPQLAQRAGEAMMKLGGLKGKPKSAMVKKSVEIERGAAEDIEAGKEKYPQEYSVWTPQTSWQPSQAKDDTWTPQTSWGESGALAETAAKAAADAAEAG